MACLIIADLYNRALFLEAHYTDFGTMPRGAYIEKFSSIWRGSLHFISGHLYFQSFLFILAAVIALTLLFGYKTKLATVLSWVFLISLQNRNYMLLQGGDVYFRMILFWGMFLPLGARYSIDSALSSKSFKVEEPKAPDYFISMGSIAFIFQILIVYGFNALHKYHADWRIDYTALWYALQLDQFTLPLGIWLREHRELCKYLTRWTIYFEAFAPFLIFIPFAIKRSQKYIRYLMIFVFISFHIGTALTMNLGLFAYIACVAWLALLPSDFWSYWGDKLKRDKSDSIEVFYDGDCSFCKKILKILIVFLHLPKLKVSKAQDKEEALQVMNKENSWIVQDSEGSQKYRFGALAWLISNSPHLFWLGYLLSAPTILGIGNIFYKWIANNRRLMGSLTVKLKFREMSIRPSLIGQIITFYFFVVLGLHNYSTLDSNKFTLPRIVSNINSVLLSYQKWNMFSSKPSRDDGWFVIKGRLRGGEYVSLWGDADIEGFTKPENIVDMYPSQRWRKYMMNIHQKKHKAHRLYLGKWICRNWNRAHTGLKVLDTFEIYFMLERTKLDLDKIKIKKLNIWNHQCFKKVEKKN